MRERFLGGLEALALPRRRVHPGIADDALFGGVDIAATLTAGQVVESVGLLAEPAALVLTMAERCPAGLAGRLGRALDEGRHAVVALDEGAGPDEGLPEPLSERLGLFVDLSDVAWGETAPLDLVAQVRAARARVTHLRLSDADRVALVEAAEALGIVSLRVPIFAGRAALAAAALAGREAVAPADLWLAAELVYAHRATAMAFDDEEAPPPPPEAPDPETTDGDGERREQAPDEMLVEAARAALPPDLLQALAAGRASRAARAAAGSGAKIKGNRRGRPLPPRAGRIGGPERLDLVATLRAAAPWQGVRGREGARLEIRPSDIRVRRSESRSDRLLVFAVDASGSTAMARLSEAKGAVELLLAEAYARRDHVALVSFRGVGAEILLPPTRSLVQTKRRLAGLPGGGGTPLAAGLQAAFEVATLGRSRGMTPSIALLTDGRANIALDGRADRAGAAADAETLAKAIRAHDMASLVIDTSVRPQAPTRKLAETMDAAYVPMPRAQAEAMSVAVARALGG